MLKNRSTMRVEHTRTHECKRLSRVCKLEVIGSIPIRSTRNRAKSSDGRPADRREDQERRVAAAEEDTWLPCPTASPQYDGISRKPEMKWWFKERPPGLENMDPGSFEQALLRFFLEPGRR